MKEIKFRGKSMDDGKWLIGCLYTEFPPLQCIGPKKDADEKLKHFIIFPGFADWNMPRPLYRGEVNPATVGQFTGLRDKVGKEVYDGDILADGVNVGEVKWLQEHCAFVIRNIKPHKYVYMESDGKLKYTEVIGNIHDNPDLLTVQP